ncbi:hypothetical protein OG291_27550 [Streptomyces halstedii]|uniref:hypothetical protein n=1 Tax=Streptomyces halstedii TaxID=1944 RepID=UPI0038664FB8|nr:hypothetical protein OG291_27550 [Streptomyces halstedii]
MTGAHGAAAPILPEVMSGRISYAEIATLAQVKRPVVTTWARRHADFPQPVEYEGGSPVFDGRAVVEWLLTTGRGNTDARQLRAELALHTLSSWCRRMPARTMLDGVTALIHLRHELDEPLADLGWDALLQRADEIDFEDTYIRREVFALTADDEAGPALAGLADELIEAAYSPAEAVEWIMEARRRLGCHDLALNEPAPPVTMALARISGIATLEEDAEDTTVAVPYASSGDLLVALHAHTDAEVRPFFLAAEPTQDLARLARRRLLVRGVQEYELDVAEGQHLATDDWGYPRVIVCVLPYGAAEARNPLAVLQQIQDLTDLLADHCTAVVLGPSDALVHALPPREGADRLRRSFLTEGLLKAAVGLPEGAVPYRPAYRTAIWVLSRTPKEERRGQILLVDLSSKPLTAPVLDALVEDLDIFRTAGWRTDGRHEPRNGEILAAIGLRDRPGTAFGPQHRSAARRYTRAVVERPARISDLELRLAQLADKTRLELSLTAELKAHAVLRAEERPFRRTSVSVLVRQRRLRRLPGHRIASEHLTVDGHYPVLTPDEITGFGAGGARRIDRGVLLTAYEHAEFTQPGDVVVTATPSFGACVDEEGLSVVGFPARVLRVRPDAERPVRPRVLAALLRAAAAENARVGGAVRAARRIEDLPIPDLDQEEADRYEALLTEINRRTALLRQQTAALDDLAALTAAGLTDGTLTLIEPPASFRS